jgi:hypothetical protein
MRNNYEDRTTWTFGMLFLAGSIGCILYDVIVNHEAGAHAGWAIALILFAIFAFVMLKPDRPDKGPLA